jgi:hypothetical protein
MIRGRDHAKKLRKTEIGRLVGHVKRRNYEELLNN